MKYKRTVTRMQEQTQRLNHNNCSYFIHIYISENVALTKLSETH